MRPLRKFLIVFAAVFSGISGQLFSQVKVTNGAVLTMDPNSLLELESTTKGLLVPRMAINSLSLPAPLTAPVPVGMLVYSIGGTIPDGFYYWSASLNWVRLIGSTDPNKDFNLVSKSANATLLKTENLVFASGNSTTLTLPTVTSADDGLEITIKNVGTYTDLITVVPQSGKTIDASISISLTRWRGRTFIASGSNWMVKEKETRTDNLLDISATGSFTTIAEAVAFLNSHMTTPVVVRLGGGTYSIAATQTINLPFPVTFEGLSYGESTIAATAGVSGLPLFICQTECYFKMLRFTAVSNAAGHDALRLTGNGVYYEVKDCDIAGFNKGLVSTTNTDVWFFENTFEDCAGAAIETAAGAASGGTLEMANNDFTRCAKGVNLLSGVSETVSITSCNFYNTTSGTDIGIIYTPATFTSFMAMFISNNAWNNQGTFISGFDFTRTDGRDANAYQINNMGMENENPHANIGVSNNASTTTVTTALTFYKAVWTANTVFNTTKWGIGSTSPTSGNRFTYQPTNTRDAFAVITGDLSNSIINDVVTIAVVRNGVTTTRFGESDLRITIQNQPFQFSAVIYIPNLVKNDYLELYVTSAHNNDVITFTDLQWFINTQ